ncbi:MAG: thiamine biosynthesis protein ThiF [Thiovulaceae bacterium]|nr:thiamine biosynthesis protein ThiF [Sulfurimonadaceae bacterium]
MTHGFDLENPLVCEGIIGDGCGGGRIFFAKEGAVFAFDPASGGTIKIFEFCGMPKKLTKKRCTITLACQESLIEFDLSSMTHRETNFCYNDTKK